MTPVEYCELLIRNASAQVKESKEDQDAAAYDKLLSELARKLGKSPDQVILDSLNLYRDYLRFNTRR